MCEMCREEQLVLSLLITITVPVFLKVSFVFTSVFAQTPLRKVLVCKKSAIKTSQGPGLPFSLNICNISKIPGCLINSLCNKIQSCNMNTGCGLFCLFLQP